MGEGGGHRSGTRMAALLLSLQDKKKLDDNITYSKKLDNSNSDSSKYSKTCLKQPLKNRQNKDLNDKW